MEKLAIQQTADLDAILKSSVEAGASDVHIVPQAEAVWVKHRVHGELQNKYAYPSSAHPGLVTRLKILAGLPIDEHGKPLDGVLRLLSIARWKIRLVITPSQFGPAVFCRLLPENEAHQSWVDLGLQAVHTAMIEHHLGLKHGLVLIYGSTGSGKTTTLRASARHVISKGQALISLEDPIEYTLGSVKLNTWRN